MQITGFLVVLLLQTSITVRPDTGKACFDGPRDPLGEMACFEAARDTADRRLDSLVARIIDFLPDRRRAAFDSASDAWGEYANAECQLLMNRVPHTPASDSAQLDDRTFAGCYARLADDRTRFLGAYYSDLLLHPESATPCLKYEPDTVTLDGILERHTYPGLPNYESIAHGDEPETGWYLRLLKPVCVTGNLTEFNSTAAAVSFVQIAASTKEDAAFRKQRGRRVTIRGALIQPGTVHWHAPLGLITLEYSAETASHP